MSQNNEKTINPCSVAVVGKSLLFPVSLSPDAFWPNLLAMIIGDPHAGPFVTALEQWPFSEFITSQDLKNLKGFIMTSGILATGSLPAAGFEIPPEILKISDMLRVIPLCLANQALNDTRSFKKGLIKANRVRVVMEARTRNSELRQPIVDEQMQIWQKAMCKAGLGNEEMKKVAEAFAHLTDTVSAAQVSSVAHLDEMFARHHGFELISLTGKEPVPGCLSWLGKAVKELQGENADLVIAGGIDSVHHILARLSDSDAAPMPESRLHEGLAIVALRRLEDAQRDGDQVLAIISDVDNSSIGFVCPARKTETPAATSAAPAAASSSGNVSGRIASLVKFSRLPAADLVFDDTGNCQNLPFNNFNDDVANAAMASNKAISALLDWKRVRECWVRHTGSRRFFQDLLGVLCGTFVSRIVLQNPKAFAAVSARPVIYLANHQIGIESPLFMALSYAMTGLPIQAVAKPDHVDAWLSFLMAFAQDSLGEQQPFKLMYFDRQNPLGLIDSLKKSGPLDASLLVHVEGTRSMTADQPVAKMSSIFLDMAIEKGIPMVPVRFVGGLPKEATENRLDFPYENGKQDYIFGTPVLPEQLKSLPYGQRPRFIMDKINTLGPDKNEDVLLPPSREFAANTRFFVENLGLPKIQAMLFSILQAIDDPSEETAVLINAVQSGKLDLSRADFPPVLNKFITHLKTKFA